jgi:hypothetical protein
MSVSYLYECLLVPLSGCVRSEKLSVTHSCSKLQSSKIQLPQFKTLRNQIKSMELCRVMQVSDKDIFQNNHLYLKLSQASPPQS